MKAGRELDALVAERVMGEAPKRHYSRDIVAAYDLIKHMGSIGFGCELGIGKETTTARFLSLATDDVPGWSLAEGGQHIPHAICLAALKAVGVEG